MTRDELAALISEAWETLRMGIRERHLRAADAILARYDLHPKGSIVVPAKPTEDMIAAGIDAIPKPGEVVSHIYRAMLAARPGAST